MAPSEADRTRSDVGRRTLSALILAPVPIAAIWAGGIWFALLVSVAAAILVWEWVKLCDGRFGLAGYVMAAAASLATLLAHAGQAELAVALLAAAALAGGLIGGGDGAKRGWLAAGVPYIGLPCLALVWLRTGGAGIVLWLFLVTWAADIGAFFAGRTIGGPKLAPRISPKKTWSGFAGGLVAATVTGAIVAGALGSPDIASAAVVSLIVAAIVALGDLLESGIKRRFSVKDASRLIPGHGGLLDRVDGLLLAAVVAALLLGVDLRWL